MQIGVMRDDNHLLQQQTVWICHLQTSQNHQIFFLFRRLIQIGHCSITVQSKEKTVDY